ncbi:hypothetical protein EX895_006494 [Sporisorium graminicola]|uniref:Uncharacterized protein n=1 Tax=Sporisorium graminicola TaxID=280036 RepID=A0A4U7KNU4_9BASI|nr:hypothetical protein EX895_006494 [Sporisorium graminicola]TKY84592.1 hypothetical protein EX895_006494 [Sporisorium graminicola]
MNAFDGDSDLSDVSAPPTPGPAATPRAASPEQSPPPTTAAAAGAAPASPQPTNTRRASRRVVHTVSASEPDSTPVKTQPPAKKASSSTKAGPSNETPTSSRRASTRDRKQPARLRSRSPSADQQAKPSPVAKSSTAAAAAAASDAGGTASSAVDTSKAKITVKLGRKPKAAVDDAATTGDSGSSRGATPQPLTAASTPGSARKVTLKRYVGTQKKLADDLRDLADDDEDDDGVVDAAPHDAHSEDDFVPDQSAAGTKGRSASGKRDRNARGRAEGRRRAVIADDEDGNDVDEAEGSKAPQRKRAKLASDVAKGGARGKGKNARAGRRTVEYSDDDDDDEDEEMVDAASDEEDLVDAAAALDSEDDFDDDDGPTRAGKGPRKGKEGGKKTGGRASGAATAAATTSKGSAMAGSKKPGPTGSATSSTSAGSKAMSAEARMRASIDAAKDKSLKSATGTAVSSTKLNPQASAFRPSVKAGPGGASTPTGAGRPGPTPSGGAAAAAGGVKRTPSTGGSGAKPAFGKSMSGWDQLFGGLSGLSSSSPKSAPTKPGAPAAGSKPSTPASATGIRPDPRLEAATAADMQRLKQQASQSYLNTDECFDLLAHADIMLAFERSVYAEDRKLAARLRPAVWKAGAAIQGKAQQVQQQQQQQQQQAQQAQQQQ